MIIICEKCNKKFNLNDSLMPEGGRLLKCGNCDYEWFHQPMLKSDYNDHDHLNKTKNIEEVKKNTLKSDIPIFDIKEKKKINLDNADNKKKIEIEKDKSKYILHNLLIYIITFIGILILFDTFKLNLSKFIPSIIPFLDSLYQSLYDLKLFLKDLFN